LSVATKIYLFKPQSNILKENNNLIRWIALQPLAFASNTSCHWFQIVRR
jgi:hypothetical protein